MVKVDGADLIEGIDLLLSEPCNSMSTGDDEKESTEIQKMASPLYFFFLHIKNVFYNT